MAEILKGKELTRWLASTVQVSDELQACAAYIRAWNGYQNTMKAERKEAEFYKGVFDD